MVFLSIGPFLYIGVVNELLYADNLVIMSEDMEDLKKRFWNWKDALESKGLKVYTRKTKLMVSGSEGELFKSKIDPCGIYGKRVMANSVLCTKCGSWVYGKCAKIKRVTASRDVAAAPQTPQLGGAQANFGGPS